MKLAFCLIKLSLILGALSVFFFCEFAGATPQPDSSESIKAGSAFIKSRVPGWKKHVDETNSYGKIVTVSSGVTTTTQRIDGHERSTSEFNDGAVEINLINPEYTARIRKEKSKGDFRVVTATENSKSRGVKNRYPMSLQAIIDKSVVVPEWK